MTIQVGIIMRVTGKSPVLQVHTSSARESEACISGVCSSLPHPTTQQYPSLQSFSLGFQSLR